MEEMNTIIELNDLFDNKVSDIKEQRDELSAKELSVTKKYADAYIKLVKDVIKGIKKMGRYEKISARNDLIGRYYVAGDRDSLESEAILTEEGLDISLHFCHWTDKYRINTEEGYNEELLNKLLEEANITVKTDHGDGATRDASIKVVYRRVKKLEDENNMSSNDNTLAPTKVLGC